MAKVKFYTVVALACSGLGGAVYRNGQTVKETDFPIGHAEKYVKSGHIKPVDAEEEAEEDLTSTGSNAGPAIEAIGKIVDIDALKAYAEHDERSTVKKAFEAKLAELEATE